MTRQKISLTIDGKMIRTDAGTPLLQVALDNGIEIPHFCYHPGIGVEGSCRLCLVEIQGMPKLQTSCTVPAKEGMVVVTDSEEAKNARKGVLEFFLLNHPLDCPFCDKGGECPLQNYTLDSGQFESRFVFEKIHKAKHQSIGDHILLDKERCVLCNRCVRFGRELAGHEELSIRNRGASCEIFIPEGTQLTTGFTGNYADICPVGALTTKEFRFKARPWEMKTVNTICGECSLGCNVQAWKKGNDLLRLTPRIAPDVNEWWLCDKGRFGIHERPDAGRLTTAVRTSGGMKQPSAPAVADGLADELRHLPEHSLAIVATPSLTNEELFALKELAKAARGGRLFVPVLAETRRLVKRLSEQRLEANFPGDLESSDAALIIGENIEEDHPVLALRLRGLVRTKGLQILSAGESGPVLPDVNRGHLKLADQGGLWAALEKISRGQKTRGEGEFFFHLDEAKELFVFLSDRVVTRDTMDKIELWLESLAESSERNIHVSFLLNGANSRGLIDQWDVSVRSTSELETEIQRGKVEGLLWFGPAPASTNFGEYARGMRTFAQFVPSAKEAHRSAKWILPLDLSTEKGGTYTNHFGRVQILRKAKRVIEKGFAPLDLIRAVAQKLGKTLPMEAAQLYGDAVTSLPMYPRQVADIPEVTKTYTFYERALWR